MTFEVKLFSKTRLKKYQHCLELMEANARLAPLWERVCLATFVSIGPPLARLFGAEISEAWKTADEIIADILAVTQLQPEEITRLLREYVRIRMEKDAHLPFDEARGCIYDQSFYPIVTHFTYALQPSASSRLNFVREIVQLIGLNRASIGDLGCGSGVILSEILLMKPHWKGYGLDISAAAIKYARALATHKRVAARADFRVGDTASLPYADESLDVIVASEIIEHMPEPLKVIDEIKRVLRPCGKLILTMPVESHTPGHIHALGSIEDLRSLCDRAGLRVCKLEPRWHLGFGDDRKHIFALAESGGRVRRSDYVSPDALRNFSRNYPEPETV